MTRLEWAEKLAELIRPTAIKAATTQIARLLSYLSDLPAQAFTEESVAYLANRKAGTPLSLMWLRETLNEYLRTTEPRLPRPPPLSSTESARREWNEREAFLRLDWSDAAGILRKVEACKDEPHHLRFLARIVGKWAPQHLGLLPPAILEEVARDPEMTLPVFVELRARLGDDERPPRTRDEQLNALGERRKPTPNYLDPAYLDQVNPLPNGRKRTDATTATTPTAQHPRSSERLADC
jgi:hypothetical protein